MWLMIIFNITKDQVFNLTVEDACLEKPKGGGLNWLSTLSLLRVNELEELSFYDVFWLTSTKYWV